MASKDFFLKFEWRVWKSDPAIRRCRPATRGIWWDLICAMCENDKCGRVSGTLEQLARDGDCSEQEMAAAIADLRLNCAADVTEHANGVVTLANRRMSRDYDRRIQARNRQNRHRGKDCHAVVTHDGTQNLPSDYYSDCFVTTGEVDKTPAPARDILPPAPLPLETPASSSARFNLRPVAVAAFSRLPTHARKKQPAFERAFVDAMVIHGAAVETLERRLSAYYASPEGTGKYFRQAHTWLEDIGWLEPDDAWKSRDSRGEKPRATADQIIAAQERRKEPDLSPEQREAASVAARGMLAQRLHKHPTPAGARST